MAKDRFCTRHLRSVGPGTFACPQVEESPGVEDSNSNRYLGMGGLTPSPSTTFYIQSNQPPGGEDGGKHIGFKRGDIEGPVYLGRRGIIL